MGLVRFFLRAAAAGLTLAVALLAAPPAGAAVTVGSTAGDPDQNTAFCQASACTFYNEAGGQPTARVPASGTIVSWRLNALSTGGTVSLRVLRASGGGLTGAGTSAPVVVQRIGVNEFPASLPVQAGDVLALDNATDGIYMATDGNSNLRAFKPPLADGGSARAPDGADGGRRLLLEAVLEPGAGAPGAPDKSAPETTIKAGPTAGIVDRTPTFRFTATELGSRFECKLDGGSFKVCKSPFTTRKLAKGKHSFAVRAIDLAKNVDVSPVKLAFQVFSTSAVSNCDGQRATIVAIGSSKPIEGTSGSDVIVGSGRTEVINGGAGADRICGKGGSDVLSGGEGNDSIEGGAGGNQHLAFGRRTDDQIFGGPGRDRLEGNEDRDRMFGGSGNDKMYGGPDGDYLFGADQAILEVPDSRLPIEKVKRSIARSSGPLAVLAAEGDKDEIEGDDGDDLLFGDSGTDRMRGKGGRDFMVGGDGNDAVLGGDDKDTLFGGRDDDSLYGEGGGDRLFSQDDLEFDFDNDKLFGGPGNDVMTGSDAGHEMSGGEGNDTITGGVSVDRIHGDEGNDIIVGYGGFHDELHGDAGDDTISVGTKKNPKVSLSPPGPAEIEGGAGRDKITASEVDDEVRGGGGNDTLLGAGGVDRVFGGDGSDNLSGGDGLDRVFGEDGDDRIDGGLGDDLLDGSAGDDLVVGGEGQDDVNGNTGNDLLRGGNGNDRLTGSSGVDRLFGENGFDTLLGGSSEDVLVGGNDPDSENGGADFDGCQEYVEVGGNTKNCETFATRDGERGRRFNEERCFPRPPPNRCPDVRSGPP